MKEEWKDIPGYEGLYQASNLGQIQSTRKTTCTYPGRLLKTVRHPRYIYPRVTLFKNGTRDRQMVHRLIALAFIGPVPQGKQINHKNGIKDDNRLNNIEYVTPSENLKHARKVLGLQFGNYKLTEKEVSQIRSLYATGKYTWMGLGARFGISGTHAGRIIKHESWK